MRIQGSSLRMRVSRSELARLVETGCLEETIYFGTGIGAQFTYALIGGGFGESLRVEATSQRVTVVLPDTLMSAWSSSEQVGIDAEIDVGKRGTLAVLIEKDFACLDRNGDENADTFPNPLAAHIC